MTTYLSARRSNHRKWLKNIGIAAVFVMFVFFWPAIRSIFVPLYDTLLVGYVRTSLQTLSIGEEIKTFFTYKTTLREYAKSLEIENEQLYHGLLLMQGVTEGATTSLSSSTVVVIPPLVEDSIVASPLLSLTSGIYSRLRIDKGFRHGVEEEALVYARGLFALGTVEEVNENTSLVALFSHQDDVVGVVARTGMVLVIRGVGGGSFVTDIQKGIDLVEGDTILYQRDERFRLGTIVKKEGDQEDVTYRVYIASGYNPSMLNKVYLYKD